MKQYQSVYFRILEIYPFVNDQELSHFKQKAILIKSRNQIKKIDILLKLLNNPHAIVKEFQGKEDKSIYQSTITRPKDLDNRLPYGKLIDDILYIEIPTWSKNFERIIPTLDSILESNRLAKGYIIDLRKNGGGTDINSKYLAEKFLPAGKYIFGRQLSKNNEGQLIQLTVNFYSKNEQPIAKPIVLLTSTTTFSTCERFVALMKLLTNVTIIGSETGGGSANPEIMQIEIDQKIYHIAIPRWRFYLNGKTKPIEETKIKPDIYHDPTKKEIIDFSVKYITNNGKNNH